jgi:hypothetical protein
LPADPVRLKITSVNVLIRTWESEADFNGRMRAKGAVLLDTAEYRDDRFVTIESDPLTVPGPDGHFIVGFSDWGRPSFTTFAPHPELPLLACGCNNIAISIDVTSGQYRTAKLAGYFRQFIAVSPTLLVVDAEVGVYGLSWNLDDTWHKGTDLIQSATQAGSTIVLATDSGELRIDIGTGKLERNTLP